MSEYFYSCNNCHRVLVNDRFHLVGSEDFDLCHYDYSQLDTANKQRFMYVVNEHMGGAGGFADVEDDLFDDELEQAQEAQVPVTEDEDFAEALYGVDSDDDRSFDSMSTGSLDDFVDEIVVCEEPIASASTIGPIEIMDLDTFVSQEVAPQVETSWTRMENKYGEEESDWSETEDEAEDQAVEDALVETAQDRQDNHEVIRVSNRAFGKRQIKPRLGNLFTYPVNHIKNGGQGEY
jgi:hypothetical protein